MSAFNFFKLFIFITLMVFESILSDGAVPSSCNRFECPKYELIHKENENEIRRYYSVVLISTSPIEAKGIVEATKIGFKQLFDYVQGKNDKHQKIEMTAPVITQVALNTKTTSCVVSFYVPKKYQADPPKAEGLGIQNIGTTYAAIRQFPGFVSNVNAREQVTKLIRRVSKTQYGIAINKTHGGDPAHSYILGQYNSPKEPENRTNEIWLTFKM